MAGSTYPGSGYPGEYFGDTAGVITPAPFRITLTFVSAMIVPATSGKGAGPVPTSPPTLVLSAPGGIRPNTLSIVDAVGQVQTLDCEVEDRHGSKMFNLSAPFHVQDSAVTIFYGDLDEVEINSFESPYNRNDSNAVTGAPVGARFFRLRGTGLNHLATRLVTGAFSAQARVPIATVVAAVAAPLGLAQVISTAGSISLPDSFLSEQETIADALTRLADLATGLSGVVHLWSINYPGTSFSSPTLYFNPITDNAATSSLGMSGYPIRSGSIRVRYTREQFKNSAVLKLDRYLKGGGESQVDTKAGSDIFLGTLTLTSPLAGEPSITVEGVEETVGIKDSDTGKDWYWSLGSNVLKVGASGASGTDEIVVTYPAHDLRAVTVTNSALVAAYGLFQLPVQSPDSGNTANPLTQASMELSRHSGFTTEVTLTAQTPSGAFKAGQLIPISLSGFGSLGVTSLSGYFYCKSIRTYDEDLTVLWREFVLLSGPQLFSAPMYLRRLTR